METKDKKLNTHKIESNIAERMEIMQFKQNNLSIQPVSNNSLCEEKKTIA